MLIADVPTRRFARRTILYREGDDAACAYRMYSGIVLLYRENADGVRTGFALVRPGETFGEEILHGLRRRHHAITLEETHRQIITLSDDGVREQLVRDALLRAYRLEEMLEARNATDRVQRIRARYAPYHLKTGTIAILAAARPETVSRALYTLNRSP